MYLGYLCTYLPRASNVASRLSCALAPTALSFQFSPCSYQSRKLIYFKYTNIPGESNRLHNIKQPSIQGNMAATSSASQTQNPKSQYHHFIPRFILRNFVHPPNPSKAFLKQSPKTTKHWKKGGRNYNEPMIYAVDLSKPTAEIVERPVSRTFGMTDMYRDFANSSNQHYLEEELSKLESRAAETVSRIRKHFEEGKTEVWITRPDRNTLRKFLFIMKYRSSRMHKRFFYQNAQGYSSDDKERLLRYMNEKGFKKPVDVWFDNIKGMLELKMDAKGDWMRYLLERIYPDDAKWFIAHTQMMYLALCTPANKDHEFLLTENAYGIYEGPSSSMIDPKTGALTMECYTEYHKFAVISPKLIMVLRSFLLPVPEEDLSEGIKEWRETMYKLNASQHNYPYAKDSVLADLPITKPRNSYSKIVDGRVVLLNGEDGSHRADHKFCFRFFPLMTEHVNKINAIMLEESYLISNIVFKSHAGLRIALEYYLTMPANRGLKLCGGGPDDLRLRLLKKLEQLVKQMGSDVTAVYRTGTQENREEHEEILARILEENLPKEPTEFMQLYIKLGEFILI